ncbi:type II toxin-antitoxin system prevent-host-death family antitoxin [Methylopila sp. M107]|uniref:type II toxin-antitoxin system prevent-host-death family antitoxin n=1 Tax=Methylopila sp. M107 TaxID=1101190 RepID=UPI0003625308|nr:type II toxin-antitoxin system prevent-host-death family antitoxin [Methylopila sp. M107]
MTTFTSRRFNQDASGAKRATAQGPVFVTDRGRRAHVLMTIEQYDALTKAAATAAQGPSSRSIVDMLAIDGDVCDEFDKILEDIREEGRRQAPRPVDLD